MRKQRLVSEQDLAVLAKRCRKNIGITKSEAARRLEVTKGTIHQAEEYPEIKLTKLRIRMIELFSRQSVEGPLFRVVSD